MKAVIGIALAVVSGLGFADNTDSQCSALLTQNQAQLALVRQHADLIGESVSVLKQSLSSAEKENSYQAKLIDQLEQQIAELRSRDPLIMRKASAFFFRRLQQNLGLSPIYKVLSDRIIIAADEVFIYGKAEVGAEGLARLDHLVDGIVATAAELPENLRWRLQLEGHTDVRPLKAHRQFADNWELSTARSLAVLKLLSKRGVSDMRLQSVGLAATRLLAAETTRKAHRKNRRIEIHLVADTL